MSTQAKGTGGMFSGGSGREFKGQLKKIYTFYTGGFITFVVVVAMSEQVVLPLK